MKYQSPFTLMAAMFIMAAIIISSSFAIPGQPAVALPTPGPIDWWEVEENDLTRVQTTALLKSSCPLVDIFQDWEKRETGHMADIWKAVEDRANTVIARGKSEPER